MYVGILPSITLGSLLKVEARACHSHEGDWDRTSGATCELRLSTHPSFLQMVARAAHSVRKNWSSETDAGLSEMNRGSVRGCHRVFAITLTALLPSASTSPHTNCAHVNVKVGKEGLEPFICLSLCFCIKLKWGFYLCQNVYLFQKVIGKMRIDFKNSPMCPIFIREKYFKKTVENLSSKPF